jgi:hypothetical protein
MKPILRTPKFDSYWERIEAGVEVEGPRLEISPTK